MNLIKFKPCPSPVLRCLLPLPLPLTTTYITTIVLCLVCARVYVYVCVCAFTPQLNLSSREAAVEQAKGELEAQERVAEQQVESRRQELRAVEAALEARAGEWERVLLGVWMNVNTW